MPQLTEAQSKGLALWTFGTINAQSGCQNAVIAALTFTGGFSAVRQRLREWLCVIVVSVVCRGCAIPRSRGSPCPPTSPASG